MSESKAQLKERIQNLKVQLERATQYSNERATELNAERVERQAQEHKVEELEAEVQEGFEVQIRRHNWDALQEGI